MAIEPERACTVVATSTRLPCKVRRPPAATSVALGAGAVEETPVNTRAEYSGLAASRRSAACQVCTAPAATPALGVFSVQSPATASVPVPWPMISLLAFIVTDA